MSDCPTPIAPAMTIGSATVERNIASRCWIPRGIASLAGGLSSIAYSTMSVDGDSSVEPWLSLTVMPAVYR